MWRDLLSEKFDLADVAIFGIPFDGNCSVGKGSALAPSVIRDCSSFLPPLTMNGELLPKMLFDIGDSEGFNYEDVLNKLSRCSTKKFTLILGGDHSVSILSQQAYKELNSGKVGIIHLDAHADICDFYNGSYNSHACTNRRAIDAGYSPESITMLGSRSYEYQETEFLKKTKIDVYSANDLRLNLKGIVEKVIEKYKDYDGVYLSFDIDSLDPSFAPGTGTPEAFGVSSLDMLFIITELISNLQINVMDVVEIAPPLDVNNVTTWTALKLILEILNIINKK